MATPTFNKKDYFKLRLEDGSDVKYNSLMITKGDDLLTPLTYDVKEIDQYAKNIHITGENKRIPVNEIQYIYFNISLSPNTYEATYPGEDPITIQEDVELHNVLTNIEIYSPNYEANKIIVGASKNVTLLETDDEYICSIDKLSSKEPTTIKLAVKSDVEIEDVVVKIKPFNLDGYNDEQGWIPCHITFKDIPNIKISIEGVSDIPNTTDTFILYYKIQNLSNVTAKNVRFQLREPQRFKKIDYVFSGADENSWFNEHNRIITFSELEAYSAEKILSVQYKASKRGIYDFVIHTLDNEDSLIDDQYQNSYIHTVMVNVFSDIRITTSTTKQMPYLGELFDFNINVKNLYKKQDTFKFDIFDIGTYDDAHIINDYSIENIKCEYGEFTPADPENDANKIGTWTLNDIDINAEHSLHLSMRANNIGNHFLKTVFTDVSHNDIRDFYNDIKIIEPNKQIEFNAYHAVSDTDDECPHCDDLIPICDDDFINLNDEIYYVCEIKNNNRQDIENHIYVYARLPQSFLENGILCKSHEYSLDKINNLISFDIMGLPGCKKPNSSIKICFKVKPSDMGRFTANFALATRNAHVLYKQLNLTVDTEFNNRKLEHEIKIYNFSKTNKYYRYEIDNVGEIFKFFNTGDKTLRPIDIESYEKSAVETYRGTNLRDIIEQIKEQSQYVDPLFLREGSNKLANKGYELFPDGLIRRFGLLNSEVYHYTGQFPQTTDLVDRAMKWDIDTWDTKLWAGDPYDNGIFSLTVDYTKVPSNFNILDVDNPIKNLQNLVDNVKPYGTKAICHYSATVKANLQINLDIINTQIKHDIQAHFNIPDDFTIVSTYNRFDDVSTIYHDLTATALHTEIERITQKFAHTEYKKNKIKTNVGAISSHIFADRIPKTKINDCYELITDIYNTNSQIKNIDITKPLITTYKRGNNLSDIQILNCEDILSNKLSIGFKITPADNIAINTFENIDDKNNLNNNIIYCVYIKDIDFTGFRFILNDNIIQERPIEPPANNISLQTQVCRMGDMNVLHFWGSINNEEYYHIGLCLINDFNYPTCEIYNKNNLIYNYHTADAQNDTEITFKISDKTNILHTNFNTIQALENKNKWNYLKNINTKDKYAYFENNIDIDRECMSNKINIPKLILKYDDIDIDNLDEIIDIRFNIEAQSNKKDFEEDINIHLYKDGDKYIPHNNIAREISYPSTVNNSMQDFIGTLELEQENITICSKCLKTSLGYNETCPYCGSSYVQYSNEKTNATACYHCGWINKGWDDYCHHCLSYDVEKILIDYNKTYCDNCGTLSPDYYEHCPHCFSSKVTHLTSNTTTYKIFGEDKQNIQPIVINIDKPQVKIFALNIPFNNDTYEIKSLEHLILQVHGTNNNSGKYYHCLACGSAHIGNYERCPYCNSTLINNYQVNNNNLKIFFQSGNTYMSYDDMLNKSICQDKCPTEHTYNGYIDAGDFTKEIDLLKCACHNNRDKFKLIFYVENQSYEKNINDILNLPIKDEYKAEILDYISPFNIIINNLSLDYKYKNEYEWVHLDKLQYDNHTGILYKVPHDKTISDTLIFNHFDIQKGKYKKAYLYLSGLLKNISDDAIMHIKINNNNDIYNISTRISDTLFTYNYNILHDIGEYIGDLSVEVYFSNVQNGEIIITDCNITTEWEQFENQLHDNINDTSAKTVIKTSDGCIIKPFNNSLWGLKDTQPYYLSGKQLTTNLIGYIDFGTLDLQEYIRVYNIDMIIYYKAKDGHLITETISQMNNENTARVLLQAVGYTKTQINNLLLNNTSLKTALNQKGKNIQSEIPEQFISGNIIRNNGELWGTINYPEEGLNNLESEITNINENDDSVNDIPLYYKIAQSFNTHDVINSISRICLDYLGKRGYPNNNITVYLCEDKNGQPGRIIASNKVQTTNVSSILKVDLNVNNLQLYTDYWIVLEDTSANNNNHHRFRYNNQNEFGQLITYTDKHMTHERCVLRFGINTIKRDKIFYNLPTIWSFDTDEFEGYKIHNTLYRYNIQNSDVSLSNFIIKNGYNITDGDNND